MSTSINFRNPIMEMDVWAYFFPIGLQQTTTVLYMHRPTQNLLAWESALFQFLHIQHPLTLSALRKVSVTLFHLPRSRIYTFAWYIDGKLDKCGGMTTSPSYPWWEIFYISFSCGWDSETEASTPTPSPSKSNKCFLAAGVTSLAAGVTKPTFVSSTWFAGAISWTVIW